MAQISMKERIARAMYERMISRLSHGACPQVHAWENQSPELVADWLSATDAALDALMEPTRGMIREAQTDAMVPFGGTSAWSVMVRAAKEGK